LPASCRLSKWPISRHRASPAAAALIIDGAAPACQPPAADALRRAVVDLALCLNPTTREVWSARAAGGEVVWRKLILPALDGRAPAAGEVDAKRQQSNAALTLWLLFDRRLFGQPRSRDS
jgi:hypothetical protein